MLNFLAWVFPAWFVATEEYELSFTGEVVVRSVDSARVLDRARIEVATEGTLDEFDRGWQLLGVIFPDNDAENWRQVSRLLAPAAFAELGDQVGRQVAGQVLPALAARPEELAKTLALVIGVSHHADPHALPALPFAAGGSEAASSVRVVAL